MVFWGCNFLCQGLPPRLSHLLSNTFPLGDPFGRKEWGGVIFGHAQRKKKANPKKRFGVLCSNSKSSLQKGVSSRYISIVLSPALAKAITNGESFQRIIKVNTAKTHYSRNHVQHHPRPAIQQSGVLKGVRQYEPEAPKEERPADQQIW